MRKANKSGKTSKSKSRHLRLALAFLGLSLAAAGCRNPTHTAGDPLMGPVNPPGINGQPLPPATGKAQSEVPPLPTTQNNNTAAGLANNTQLPGGRPQGIGQEGPNWQLTNIGKGHQMPPTQTPTVQPVPRDPPPPPGGLQPSSWSSAAQPDSVLAPLKARGAVGEQEETVPGGIRFSCFLPSRANPANLRQYEVTAPDLASAVQAILRQIDNPN
jgi:hypothetical protein